MEFQSYGGPTLRRSVRLSWPAGAVFVLTSSNIQAAVYDKLSVRESVATPALPLVNTIPTTGGIPEHTIRPPRLRACALRNMEAAARLVVNKHRVVSRPVNALYGRVHRPRYKHFRLYYFETYAATAAAGSLPKLRP